MAMTIEQLLSEALQLAPTDRETIAERLYASLDANAPLSAEWDAVIEQRLTEIEQDPSALFDGESVFEEARVRIQSIRAGT